MEQIHKLIIEGYNIRVLDAKTNEEITSRVLTQILLEYEPVNLEVFYTSKSVAPMSISLLDRRIFIVPAAGSGDSDRLCRGDLPKNCAHTKTG